MAIFVIFFACPRETLSRKNTHIFFCFGCKNSRFLWAMFICSFGGASDRGPYFTLLNFGEILPREGVNDSPKGCPSLLELGTCALASTRDYLSHSFHSRPPLNCKYSIPTIHGWSKVKPAPKPKKCKKG